LVKRLFDGYHHGELFFLSLFLRDDPNPNGGDLADFFD
jgi:hypothetical protein